MANGIEQLILRMADENPDCGYSHIHGASRTVDIESGRGTIRSILKDQRCRGLRLAGPGHPLHLLRDRSGQTPRGI